MKLIYLHGLESKAGGIKVDWLRKQGHEVYAPEMDYHNPMMFQNIWTWIKQNQPDYIIGSSMGGYFAYLMGTRSNIPCILLNPALHSRAFEPVIKNPGALFPRLHVLLGTKDDIIDPIVTMDQLQTEYHTRPHMLHFTVAGHGHRTPYKTFKKVINTIFTHEKERA